MRVVTSPRGKMYYGNDLREDGFLLGYSFRDLGAQSAGPRSEGRTSQQLERVGEEVV